MKYPHIAIRSDGKTYYGTQVVLVTQPGIEFDLTDCIESVQWEQRAGDASRAKLVVLGALLDGVAEPVRGAIQIIMEGPEA
jgi:hypothetical protein